MLVIYYRIYWVPAAAGGSAHVHARGRGVGPLGDGVVHPDLAVVQISTVHGIASLRGVVLNKSFDTFVF